MMQRYRGTPEEWNALVAKLPGSHLLQTWEWARVKGEFGWEAMPLVWKQGDAVSAGAMLLKRRISLGGFAARLNILYVPKGPLLDWQDVSLRDRVLDDLQAFAREQGAIFLKMDPDVVLGTGVPGGEQSTEMDSGQRVKFELKRRGWKFSSDQIQFRNTVMIDLTSTEDEMLARMKQKTRYNVRLAGRKGVVIRAGHSGDLTALYRMYAETAVRDNFVIRNERYYRILWETFLQSSSPACEPLIAEVDDDPVAALFVFSFAGRAYYLYGMSSELHREKMPNYLLQWEAMRRAKAAGCQQYDLWGAPNVFDERDPLWGVFRFKRGLGGQVLRTLGAWDFPSKPLWYRLYSQVLPRVLAVMRSRGRKKTRQSLD